MRSLSARTASRRNSSSDFDGAGHYRSHATGGSFPGTNVHTAATGYNPGAGTYGQASYVPWSTASPWILGTYSFHWDSENGQLQYRSFCFDPATGFRVKLPILNILRVDSTKNFVIVP